MRSNVNGVAVSGAPALTEATADPFNATLTDSNGSEWSNVVLRESSTIIWGVDP